MLSTKAKAACLFIWLFFLTGCAVKNVDENATLNSDAADGIIVVSVSHDDEGGRGMRAIFVLDDDGQLVSLKEVVPGIAGGSEFEEVYGELYAVRLPAGRHEISSWSLHSARGIHVRPKVKPDPLLFFVHPGKVTYIGNLHMLIGMGENIFGMDILGGGHAIIKDMHERDLAVFDSLYPNLAGKASVELLKLGPWPPVPIASDRTIDPPPPIYIPPGIH